MDHLTYYGEGYVAVAASIKTNWGNVLICSTHFSALPFQYGKRKTQLHTLCGMVKQIDWDHAVMLGDFNYHYDSEIKNVPTDWKELSNAESAGPTWDTGRNTMIRHYLPKIWWGMFYTEV
jgi:endonuclease/exonuclease/phosphatase family metal-dependent hydrolase